ncbi:MAG: cytochrome-c peroxidase [Desulfobulbaceae bacterium]|nr:cytochrome-c peroxidase [Desulfobulbaceae bacterium]
MKKINLLLVLLAGAILMVGGQALAGKSSVEMGKELFNDPTLAGSTNDKSCNSCHSGGEGLEKAGDNKKLVTVINQCVTGPLEGNKIDGRTAEMRSLKMYIQSLGAE